MKESTIDSQIAGIKAFLSARDIVVDADMYFIDNGVSGSSLVRPALDQLRDKAVAGAIDKIFVLSPDRLARKYAHQLLLLDEFERLGTTVVFANRDICSDSPEDSMLLQIQGVISEYERSKIVERQRRGKQFKVKSQCVSVLSAAPYGYHYVKKGANADAQYQINFKEGKVVRDIYNLYVNEFFSVPKIAAYLDSKGIPTQRNRGGWSNRTIWNILKNPAYIGKAAYGKTKGKKPKTVPKGRRESRKYPNRLNSSAGKIPEDQWNYIKVPALVSESLFHLVPERAKENKSKSKRNRKRDYLISGLAYCAECGYRIYGYTNNGSRRELGYYRCYGQDKWQNKSHSCSARPVRVEVLEDTIWTQIRKLIEAPEQVLFEYADRTDHQKSKRLSAEKVIKRKKNELIRGQQEKQRVLDLYQKGIVGLAEIESRLQEIREAIANTEKEISILIEEGRNHQNNLQLIEDFRKFSQKMSKNLDNLTPGQKKEIVQLLVKEIAVDRKKAKIKIKHILPELPQKSYGLHAKGIGSQLQVP